MVITKAYHCFLFFFFFLQVSPSDYNTFYNCQSNSNATSLDQIDLHYIDAIFFIIAGPIASIICLTFLIIFLLNRDLLKNQPGDLYFGATFSELILSIHWTISGIQSLYNRNHNNNPLKNDDEFCQINAFISVFAGTWEMMYNICFCVYLIQKIRTLINPVEIPKFYYHLISIIFSCAFTFAMYKTDNLGKNLFGTCSFVADSTVTYLGPIVLVIYYLFSFYAIFYFNNYIPEVLDLPQFSSSRRKFLNYYYKYILVTSFIWIPVIATNLISTLNCKYIQEPLVDIALTIGDINKLNTPITLTLMRMMDPFIKTRLIEIYEKLMKKDNNEKEFSMCIENDVEEPLNRTNVKPETITIITDKKNINKTINYESANEISSIFSNVLEPKSEEYYYIKPNRKTTSNYTHNLKKKLESNNEGAEKEEITDYGLNSLTENAKVMYMKAMIIGILVNIKKLKALKGLKNSSFFNLTDFSEKVQQKKLERNSFFSIDNHVIKKEFPEMWEKFSCDFENIDLKITYFSPKLFNELLINDSKFIDLAVSLALERNLDQIKNSSKADGGRGGQFFFFSYDNQIILKSLSNDDFKCLHKILKPYYEYMVKNADSLIMKIYGVYEFTFYNNKKKKKTCIFSQKVMIMRNLSGFPKSFIERIYDLKGSTFQRESLSKKQKKENVVLKDIDFLKLEKKLFIENSNKKKLIETLKKDAMFFKENGIIDYSLLIIKINTKKSVEFFDWDNFSSPAIDGLWSLESIKENGRRYHIGIIDYLQPYNYKKILEKYSKKLMKANTKLDTSAQDPIIYSNRFCRFVEKILAIDEEKEKEY